MNYGPRIADVMGWQFVDGDDDGVPDLYDPDDDNDGIADTIEDQVPVLDRLDANDAALDADLDGFTNLQEALSGTGIENDGSVPGPGQLMFTYGQVGWEENEGFLPVEVTRLRGSIGAVSARLTTSDVTAIAGTHYQAIDQVLDWPDGDISPRTVQIPLIDTVEPGSGGIFNLTLSEPGGGVELLSTHAIGIVLEDEYDSGGAPFAGSLLAQPADIMVPESSGSVTVYIDRRSSTTGAVSVDYSMVPLLATEGEDYESKSGTLTWADGESDPKPIVITLYDDALVETVEAFRVELSNPSPNAYPIEFASTVVHILDEEIAQIPTSIAHVSITPRFAETDLPALRFVRLGDGEGEAYVDIDFYAGFRRAATPDRDYDATPQRITWAHGETGVKEIAVPLFDDALLEDPLVFESIGVTATLSPSTFAANPFNQYLIVIDIEDIDFDINRDGDAVAEIWDLDDNNDLVLDFLQPNNPPYATADLLFATVEDVLLEDLVVAAFSADPEGDPIVARTDGTVSNGNLTELSGSRIVDYQTDFEPAGGFVGEASFDYFLCDLRQCAGPFIARVDVAPAPIQFASQISDVTVPEDTNSFQIDVAAAFGVAFTTMEVVSISNPGLFEEVSFNTTQPGLLDVRLAANANGEALITVGAQDSAGDRAYETFAVSVAAIDDPPTVANPIDDLTIVEDADDLLLDLRFLFDDPDRDTNGQKLNYVVSESPLYTTSFVGADGELLRFDFASDVVTNTTVTISVVDDSGIVLAADSFEIHVVPVFVSGIPGRNVNIIGPTLTELHYPDLELRQQNEVECVFRPDNSLHLFCQYNDYRGADDEELVGDSWQGVSMSRDGGLTWTSRLAPGWKGYTHPLQRELPEGELVAGGFAADPAIAAAPGVVLGSFISSDRQDKGPGGMYLYRWFERNTEAGMPWVPERDVRQIVAGGQGKFVDKVDLVLALTDAPPVTVSATFEGDEQPTTRTLPAALLIAGYTQFNDEDAGFEANAGFDPNPADPTAYVIGPLNGQRDWTVDPPSAQVIVQSGIGRGATGAIQWSPSNVSGPIVVETPPAFAITASDLVVNAGFDFRTFDTGSSAPHTADLGVLQVEFNGANGALLYGAQRDEFDISAGTWQRIEFRIDYQANATDVFLDGRLFASQIPFAMAQTSFSGITFTHEPDVFSGYFFIDNVDARSKSTTSAEIYVTRSIDYGDSWSELPIRISADNDLNQGVSLAAKGDQVVAVWRRFQSPDVVNQSDDILYALSSDGGINWTSPQSLTGNTMCPFDQISNNSRFRTNGYAKVVTTSTGFSAFWSDRAYAQANGDLGSPCVSGYARVVYATMPFGGTWSAPAVVDDATGFGHQFMPDAYSAGEATQVAWYDTRHDEANLFEPLVQDSTDGQSFVKHTMDVRAARVINNIARPSIQVTSYSFGIDDTGSLVKLERSHPNSRIFRKGTTPFVGDYISVAGESFSVGEDGNWHQHEVTGENTSFFIAWADNRDIRGDVWQDLESATPFSPATLLADSEPDPTGKRVMCEQETEDDVSLTRDQNVYGAMLNPGFKISSPTPNKPTDQIQRGFVVYMQNFTNTPRSYQATIFNQPPDGATTGRASFSEFPRPPYFGNEAPPKTSTTIALPPRSAGVRTVYITSEFANPKIKIDVTELFCTDCQTASLTLNGNPTAPKFEDSPDTDRDDNIIDEEIRAPDIQQRLLATDSDNPGYLNPGYLNPGYLNPGYLNPGYLNPGYLNPGYLNPGYLNPTYQTVDVTAPGYLNPGYLNPGYDTPGYLNYQFENPGIEVPGYLNVAFESDSIFNSGIQTPALRDESFDAFTDIRWEVVNKGNSTGAVSLKPFLNGVTNATRSQLIVTKTYATPTIQGCVSGKIAVNQVVMSVADPDLTGDGTTDAGSIFIEPGEILMVTLRVFEVAEVPEEEEVEELPLPGEEPAPLPEPVPEPDPEPEQDAGIAVISQTCGDEFECSEEDPIPDPIVEGPEPETSYLPVSGDVVALRRVKTTSTRLERHVRLTYRNVSGAELAGALRVVVDQTDRLLKNADGTTTSGLDYVTVSADTGSVLAAGESVQVTLTFDKKTAKKSKKPKKHYKGKKRAKSGKSEKSEKSEKRKNDTRRERNKNDRRKKRSDKSDKSRKNDKSDKSKKSDKNGDSQQLELLYHLERKAPPIGSQ